MFYSFIRTSHIFNSTVQLKTFLRSKIVDRLVLTQEVFRDKGGPGDAMSPDSMITITNNIKTDLRLQSSNLTRSLL